MLLMITPPRPSLPPPPPPYPYPFVHHLQKYSSGAGQSEDCRLWDGRSAGQRASNFGRGARDGDPTPLGFSRSGSQAMLEQQKRCLVLRDSDARVCTVFEETAFCSRPSVSYAWGIGAINAPSGGHPRPGPPSSRSRLSGQPSRVCSMPFVHLLIHPPPPFRRCFTAAATPWVGMPSPAVCKALVQGQTPPLPKNVPPTLAVIMFDCWDSSKPPLLLP